MKIRQAKKIRKRVFTNNKVKYSEYQKERSATRVNQSMPYSDRESYWQYNVWDWGLN